MKKLLGIVVLGLLLSGHAYSATDTYLKCTHPSNGTKSLVFNEKLNGIMFDGHLVETPIIWGDTKVFFMSPVPYVYSKEHSNHKEVELDRVTGKLIAPEHSGSRLFRPFYNCVKVDKLF
jgi:hypothetical protein